MFTARYVLHSTFCPHSLFMCFVWIWEQTAIISLYSINWVVFTTETECVYCAVRSTFYVLPTQCIYVFYFAVRSNPTFCPHSVFMCFVCIWERTAIISLYSKNWLVFTTETDCVYWAVRSTFYVLPTQRIYVFCVDLRTNSDYFTVHHWLSGFYNRDRVFTARYGLDIWSRLFRPLRVKYYLHLYVMN